MGLKENRSVNGFILSAKIKSDQNGIESETTSSFTFQLQRDKIRPKWD